MPHMKKDDFFSRYYLTEQKPPWPFAPVSLGYNRYKPYDALPQGNHPLSHTANCLTGRRLDTVTLVHVVRGAGWFQSDAHPQRTILPANTLLFVHPGVRHIYRFDERTGWDDEWIEFRKEDAGPLLDTFGVTPEDPFHTFPVASGMAKGFQALFDAATVESGSGPLLAAHAYMILAEALTLWRHDGHTHLADSKVEKMRELLESDLVKARTLDELSRISGISASRMRFLFAQAYGISPKQYQMRMRIRRAQDLLATSSLSVTAIAELTGFDSINAFSRQFRKVTGRSPRECRTMGALPL